LGEEAVPVLRREFAALKPAHVPEAPTHTSLIDRKERGEEPIPAVRVLSKPSGLRNSAVHSLALPRVPQLSMPVQAMIRIALQSPRLSSFFRMLTTDSYISRAIRYRGGRTIKVRPLLYSYFGIYA